VFKSIWARIQILIVMAAFLQACSSTMSGEDLLENRLRSSDTPVRATTEKQRKLDRFLASETSDSTATNFDGFTRPGTDRLSSTQVSLKSDKYDEDSEDVMLNLVGVTIPQAAKSVLGNVLELEYSVDSRVAGTVTLQTPKPISRSQLSALFEAILRDNGAAIVKSGSAYRIVPLAEANRATTPLQTRTGDTDAPGTRPEIVMLRYVSASNIREVLDPMIPQGMLLRADEERNALILSGTAREIASIKETIGVFDVDWMQGMSFALVPVRSSSPQSIVQDLDQVFQTKKGPLKGVVRFVPNDRLRSVLVISSRAKYLREATRWIKKIDVLAESSEDSLHVYHVQNRNASDLAKILESILGSGSSSQQAAESRVAPKFDPAVAETQQEGEAAAATGGPETPANGMDSVPDAQIYDQSTDQTRKSQTRVVADDANNALLIYCTDAQFDRIKLVLQEVDAVPNQVLLEAVIAEVSLDDDLRFGVRWFLGEDRDHGTFSDAASGAVSSVFPGFSYFLKANDISFSLNALSSVTNVRVLSAPSLVVLDNKTATLQVGDQVPIVTQSAKAVTAADAPIVTNIELKDTGLILKVTPRVNDSGLVTLDIEQEVSSVVKTTTSGIDSPTIRQRKMKTSVVVNDSEALALGGLIQERETTGKTKVPVLGDVPLLGNAFRQKTNAVGRTELVIFIRPRVIRDLNEARRVTAEFRKELSVQAPRVRRAEPTPGSELVRIIE
jgi:general secretion pathway protein D